MISVPNAAITLWSDLRKVNAIVNKVIPIHGGWFKLWFAYWGSRPGFLLEPFPYLYVLYFYLDAIQESTVVFLICLIRHSLVAGFGLLTQPGCFSG